MKDRTKNGRRNEQRKYRSPLTESGRDNWETKIAQKDLAKIMKENPLKKVLIQGEDYKKKSTKKREEGKGPRISKGPRRHGKFRLLSPSPPPSVQEEEMAS